MSKPTLSDRWSPVFVPEGDGPPAEVRVRRMLKGALRTHRLRCIDLHSPRPVLLRCHALVKLNAAAYTAPAGPSPNGDNGGDGP